MRNLTLERARLSAWVRVLGIALFAVLTAISARISVLVPFSPVPLTLQVMVVILSGFALGAKDALIAQLVYLQAILLGAPYTAAGLAGPAAFVSPTAGYLLAFPMAAFVSGWLSHRVQGLKVAWRALGGVAGLAVIYLAGAAWLGGYVGGMSNAWTLGVAPFVAADALKVLIVTAAMSLRER